MRYVNEVTVQGRVGSISDVADLFSPDHKARRVSIFTETPQGNPVWHVADLSAAFLTTAEFRTAGRIPPYAEVRVKGYLRQELKEVQGAFYRADIIIATELTLVEGGKSAKDDN